MITFFSEKRQCHISSLLNEIMEIGNLSMWFVGKHQSFLVEGKGRFIWDNLYHGCLFPANARSQSISSHGIDFGPPEFSARMKALG